MLDSNLTASSFRTVSAKFPLPRPHRITSDDWGFSPAINDGILELVRAGVMRRVSIMATEPYVQYRLSELTREDVELGLHYNLTQRSDRNPIPSEWSIHPLRWILSGSRRLDVAMDCLRAQLDVLRDLGVKPTYVDGHHHIHIIPGWIDRAAPLLKEQGISWVRAPYRREMLGNRNAPLALLGLRTRIRAAANGFRSLPFYYPTLGELRDTAGLARFIDANPGTEIVVHPANRVDEEMLATGDRYTDGRVAEYEALVALSAYWRTADSRANLET